VGGTKSFLLSDFGRGAPHLALQVLNISVLKLKEVKVFAFASYKIWVSCFVVGTKSDPVAIKL
jgi:hypothetical protein